jgi:ubiquitin-like-conjugating enzyme ATG3
MKDDSEEEIMDMDEYIPEENEIKDFNEVTISKKNDLILKTRTYDISITYDKYYQTPRVWLFGYDESENPLESKKILEDIWVDYSKKTVTIENHPHLNLSHASIHPCKHADVMVSLLKLIFLKKKMIDRLQSEGQYVRVDLYLFIFLKFISSVIPTIDYDFTVQFNVESKKKEEKVEEEDFEMN